MHMPDADNKMSFIPSHNLQYSFIGSDSLLIRYYTNIIVLFTRIFLFDSLKTIVLFVLFVIFIILTIYVERYTNKHMLTGKLT